MHANLKLHGNYTSENPSNTSSMGWGLRNPAGKKILSIYLVIKEEEEEEEKWVICCFGEKREVPLSIAQGGVGVLHTTRIPSNKNH